MPFSFLDQSIWNPWFALKVGFFAWEVSWGKVLTLDQLKRRGRPLANRCNLCEREEETIEHLLVHRPQTRTLRELILAIGGISINGRGGGLSIAKIMAEIMTQI